MALDQNPKIGYCLVCRNSILFDQRLKKVICSNCIEKNSSDSIEGGFCHYCGKQSLTTIFNPICFECSFKVESIWQKVLELNPNSSMALTNLGDILRHQGKYPEAETAYRKALDLDPNNIIAWTNLGLTYVSQKGSGG